MVRGLGVCPVPNLPRSPWDRDTMSSDSVPDIPVGDRNGYLMAAEDHDEGVVFGVLNKETPRFLNRPGTNFMYLNN